MERFLLFAVLILLLPTRVMATSTMCDFYGADESSRYSFEFIGHGEIAMIQVNEPRSMRVASYKVRDFNYRERRIDIVHEGSDKPGFLPAFTLRGSGNRVMLRIGGREIAGELVCQWQLDAK